MVVRLERDGLDPLEEMDGAWPQALNGTHAADGHEAPEEHEAVHRMEAEEEREYLEDSLRTYLREIGRVKLPSGADERLLGRRLETAAYL